MKNLADGRGVDRVALSHSRVKWAEIGSLLWQFSTVDFHRLSLSLQVPFVQGAFGFLYTTEQAGRVAK